ncbi:MAG: HutD family protein [Planctomycetes bacterium]|nr:HutD family protein [Planctomycetota bacterium]
MNARVVRLHEQREMPWANGGGSTREVAIAPPGASLATGFHWRISRAHVGSDGPFSHLPGVDRSLWLLAGNGMRLRVDGRDVVLDEPLQRFDFAGETPIHATLLAGACSDLNVMTARGSVRGEAAVVEGELGCVRVARGETVVLLVLDGELGEVGGAFRLTSGDAVVGDGPGQWRCVGAPAAALVARFRLG